MADSSGGLESTTSGGLNRQNAQDGLSEVLAALKIVYDPNSSNPARQEASFRLDDAKRAPQAPAQGFEIASNTNNDDTLRHFGLSMMEYYIKYVWDGRSDVEIVLREYVIQLARDIRPQDPPYIRNKVAQLWTELAKRSWADQWMNMDELLVKISSMSITHQLLVLTILETLVEQVFNREDPAAGVRGGDLGTACTEIFTPESVLKEIQSSPEDKPSRLRCGGEGWLHRLCVFINQSLVNNSLGDAQIHGVIVKTLTTIRATLSWINIKAISAVHVPTTLIQTLANGDTAMRTAAVEAMVILYSRGKSFDDTDFDHIVNPMYSAQKVALLHDAYRWAVVDAHDIDEEKYDFLKKLAEMISHLGHLLSLKPLQIRIKDSPNPADIANLYSLFLAVTSNPSMSVSIHCLELWAHFVRYNKPWSTTEAEHYNSLLEICRQRLVRYEVLPEGFQDDTWLFLQEDFDTVAERHTFVSNYRKYCVEVVHQMIPRYPSAITIHLLDEAKTLIGNLSQISSDFNAPAFSKYSMPGILVDAHLTVVDAAIKGYFLWDKRGEGSSAQTIVKRPKDGMLLFAGQELTSVQERLRTELEDVWQSWCESILSSNVKDPEVLRRLNTLVVTITTKILDTRPSFAITVLDYFLSLNIVDDPSFPQYSDSVKNLRYTNTLELQRLAIAFANDFAPFYEELESKIAQNLDSLSPNLQTHLGYRAFLLIIVHRAQDLDSNIRLERMRTLLIPVKEAWEGSEVTEIASDFGKFCKYLGLGHLPEYLSSRGFDKIQDWSNQELDLEGQQLQANIQHRTENMPIRLTKTLLIASVEKLKPNSVPFEIARQMWAELMPSFLPDLLQIINHAEAFYDFGKWSSLPPEMQQVIRRICTDRFWQAGISTESKDDFFARVSASKHTYEGFASTVRGSVRQVRESAYQILMYLIKFKDSFYAIKDLPGPLSEALYGNAFHLSPHHFAVLLTTSTHIIDGCPVQLRRHFLPTLLSKLFSQIDHKLTNEWSLVYQHTMQAGPGDDLGDEMKTESILRQLTYSAIMLAYTLLDQRRIGNDVEEGVQEQPDSKMYKFILDRADILEPVLIFVKNALRFRDTRTVGKAVEIFRSILPSFREPSTVHTFLCRNVLQDAIISFHEPYFVDSQRDLTTLISQIIRTDEAQAREVLLSLSPLAQQLEKVEKMLKQVRDHSENDRKVKALVWELLDGVRGQSIQEMGKIQSVFPKKPKVIKTQHVNPLNPDGATNEQKRVSPELVGVADMLG